MIAMSVLFYTPLVLLCLIAFKSSRRPDLRARTLAAANAVFLAALFFFSPRHLAGLLAALLVNFLGLRRMRAAPRWRGAVAAAFIASDTFLLAALKFHAARAPLVALWPALGSARTFVVLGAPFAYLRLVHLFADALDDPSGAAATMGLAEFLNFICFFPAYLSGPIERYDRFAAETREARGLTYKGIYESTGRIIGGFFKRFVLADNLQALTIASIPDRSLHSLAPWQILLGLFLFGAQVYLEFSGYTDVAIGTAGLMGLRLPENFNRPYLARNLQDFWSRWHITFVSWLRDYVYYPAARALLSRGVASPAAAAAASVVLTFVLAGVWHGEGWNFFLYGLCHALGFLVFQAYKTILRSRLSEEMFVRYSGSLIVRGLAMALTWSFVSLSWIFYLGRIAIGEELLRRLW